jgi:hypothetical protein
MRGPSQSSAPGALTRDSRKKGAKSPEKAFQNPTFVAF